MEEDVMMKVHGKGSQGVMALCDPDLIGRELEDGDLTFKVSRSFYEGDMVNIETTLRLAPMMGSINAVGRRCVEYLVKAGIADPDKVRMISGVPHIQIYNIYS